jgi:hypothetical protein
MKLSPEFPARHVLNPAQSSPAGQTANTARSGAARTGSLQQAGTASVKDLVLSLGLPRDALSSTLLSLAKFFSLPLDAQLIRQLRQQALSQAPLSQEPPGDGSPESGPAKPDLPFSATLRSAAFAATAAAGKGVTLSPEALGSYAAAIAAGSRDREDGDDGAGADSGSGGHNKPWAESPDEADSGVPVASPRGGPEAPERRTQGGSALVERIEGRLPLLGVLNRIPGRDGRRWISLPFSFESGGADFDVSLRIALADTNSIPWKAELMALDVKTERRSWSFMLENAGNGEGQAFSRAVFGVRPPLKPAAEKALRKLLGGIAGKVLLRDSSGGAFPEEEAGAGPWDK